MNMGRLLDIAKNMAGEKSLSGAFGRWILAVSGQGDQAAENVGVLQTDVDAAEADIVQLQVDVTAPGGAYLTQAAWYVDSVFGNDANAGDTVLTAIRTLPELGRRWTGRVLSPSIPAANIALSGTFPAEVLSLSGPTIQRGQTLVVSGLLTTVANGTITTFTVRVAASDTSSTILADIGFAGHAKRRIRLTSGANSGAVATVLSDLGGNTCRVSGFSGSTGTAVVPANGDTFVIETYDTTIGGVTIQIQGGGVARVEDLQVATINAFEPVYIAPVTAISSGASFSAVTGLFHRCLFSGANTAQFVYGSAFNGCTFNIPLSTLRSGLYFISSCSWVSGGMVGLNSTVILGAAYCCFEGTTQGVQLTGQSVLQQQADMQVFACSGSRWGLVTDNASWAYTSAVRIYGGGNTFTVAFEVRSGCSLQYVTNKPTILGNNPGVNDIKLGGTDFGWAAIPTINVANNAMAVVRQ